MTVYNCLKHGIYTPPSQVTAADCPHCRAERNTPCTGNSPALSQAKEAVIAKAVGWAHARGNSSPGNDGYYENKSTEAWARELFTAVDAYVDPRPQGKKPEEGWHWARHRSLSFGLGGWEPVFVDGLSVQRVGDQDRYGAHEFHLGPRILPLDPQ